MPVEGQEDDDFAYEDEHIELESDNEEYEPLDESEFDSRSTLIRAELKRPTFPSSAAPEPGGKPADRERAPESQSPRASDQNIQASPNIPPAAPAHPVGPQAPKVKRARERPAKSPTKARAQPPVKARIPSRATKRTQPVRKKAAKPAKKRLTVKTAPAKKSSPAKKKVAPKGTKKGMRSRPTLRKKRRA